MNDTNPTPPPSTSTATAPTSNRAVWVSRLGLLGIFASVGVMIAIVFFSDPAGFEVERPPNDKLVALADELDANFETWVAEQGEIRFTLDTLAEGRSAAATADRVRALAPQLGLESLRDLSVVRISGRLKISGTIDADD